MPKSQEVKPGEITEFTLETNDKGDRDSDEFPEEMSVKGVRYSLVESDEDTARYERNKG